jgi:hypothetical protein
VAASLTKKLIRFTEARSKVVLAIAAILLAAFAGWVDDVTGMEVSVALLYIVPVVLAGWFVGRWMGIAVSVLCAIEGFIAAIGDPSAYSHPAIPYWNAAMMLGYYVAVTLLLIALRDSRNREHDIAREIQENLLPSRLDISPATTVAAAWKPSVHVGGDYFDLLPFGADGIGFCIADVSGHGIPAALLMSNVQSAVRVLAGDALSPADLCARLNKQATTNFPDGGFLTFFFGCLHLPMKRLTYCNAGHNPPIVIKHDGTFQMLGASGLPLGIEPSWTYLEQSEELQTGDKILLYTDGVTEARNPADELFGEERLMEILMRHRSSSPELIKESIMDAVNAFSQGSTDDDITLMCIEINGNG